MAQDRFCEIHQETSVTVAYTMDGQIAWWLCIAYTMDGQIAWWLCIDCRDESTAKNFQT